MTNLRTKIYGRDMAMNDRSKSTVAAYLDAAGRADRTEPRPSDWRGGKGRRGPLATWLLRERVAIARGKTPGAASTLLTWEEVAQLAYSDGVRRPGGEAYSERQLSKAWSDLAQRGLVPKLVGQEGAVSLGPITPPPQPQVRAPPTLAPQPVSQPATPPAQPTISKPAGQRVLPASPGLPAGFEDLLNPKVIDPKKPNPPKA